MLQVEYREWSDVKKVELWGDLSEKLIDLLDNI